jgi:hypothetical protein
VLDWFSSSLVVASSVLSLKIYWVTVADFFCAVVLPDNCSTVTRACDYFSLHFEFVSDDSILNEGTAV